VFGLQVVNQTAFRRCLRVFPSVAFREGYLLHDADWLWRTGPCLDVSCFFAETLVDQGAVAPWDDEDGWPILDMRVDGVLHHALVVEGVAYDWTFRQFRRTAKVPTLWAPQDVRGLA